MKPFTVVESVAAYLDEDAVDTDIIFPARFLLLMDKVGLAKHAFFERRNSRSSAAPFILDRSPYNKAEIFVGAKNFGTGSSREQAVWALADFGIRCIVAESFGEIFYANCFKNGVLPIVKSGEELTVIRDAARDEQMLTVDLSHQTITLASGRTIPFEIDDFNKDALLNGLDEIGSILRDDSDEIKTFEHRQRKLSPWLYLEPSQLAYFNDLEAEKAIE